MSNAANAAAPSTAAGAFAKADAKPSSLDGKSSGNRDGDAMGLAVNMFDGLMSAHHGYQLWSKGGSSSSYAHGITAVEGSLLDMLKRVPKLAHIRWRKSDDLIRLEMKDDSLRVDFQISGRGSAFSIARESDYVNTLPDKEIKVAHTFDGIVDAILCWIPAPTATAATTATTAVTGV